MSRMCEKDKHTLKYAKPLKQLEQSSITLFYRTLEVPHPLEQKAEHMPATKCLILTFSIALIAYFITISLLFISLESALTLIIFNLLFVSLIFHLKGTILKKTSLLTLGNVIGILWNYLFNQFAYLGKECFGETFDAICIILMPLTNLLWIVSFWSISLAELAEKKGGLKS